MSLRPGQANTPKTAIANNPEEASSVRAHGNHEAPSNPIRCAREYSVVTTACLATRSKPVVSPVWNAFTNREYRQAITRADVPIRRNIRFIHCRNGKGGHR